MRNNSAITILRWALAFVFFYAAVASLLNSQDWVGYLPSFLLGLFPAKQLLVAFSLYEIALAALLFAGRKLILVSLLAAATLAGITVFNLGVFEVTFRDVGLALSALALYELVREKKQKNS